MKGFLYRVIVFASFISLVSAVGPVAAAPARADAGLQDIVVQRDAGTNRAYLVNRVTGVPFIPTGNNYIRIDSVQQRGNTFDVGVYDAGLTETTFQQMQGYGYDTVRLFVWPTLAGSLTGSGLSDAYVANVADAVTRAVAHGMHPILSIIGLPKTGGYRPTTPDQPEYAADIPQTQSLSSPGSSPSLGKPTRADANNPPWYTANWYYFTAQARDARLRYLTDMLTGLLAHHAPLASVLAYDLTGEITFTQARYPLSVHTGTTTTKTGIYDLSSASDRQRMMDDNVIFAVNSESAAVKAIDPNALTSVQLPPGATNPAPATYSYASGAAIRAFAVDVVTLSLYPTFDKSLEALMSSFGTDLAALGKPLLTMEMGYFSYYLTLHPELTLADLGARFLQWEKDSCGYGVRGWFLFTWDVAHSDAPFYNAIENNGFFAAALSPNATPDVCNVLNLNPAQSPRVSGAPSAGLSSVAPDTRASPAGGGASSAPAPLPVHR